MQYQYSRRDDYVPFVSEVEEFNEAFNKPNKYTPNVPEKEQWEFVYNFILEELNEYKEACEKGDIVEVLDALADITYVATGNGVMLHGLKDYFEAAYEEVHQSNMSKLCKSHTEALDTVELRQKEQGEACHIEKKDEYWVVLRSRDRKVMKSINYFRPNLKAILDGQ